MIKGWLKNIVREVLTENGHSDQILPFMTGMEHALRLNYDFNKQFIDKKIDIILSEQKERYEQILETHKARVEKAASPLALRLYDEVTGLLQEARQDKSPESIKKYTAQLEILEILVNVNQEDGNHETN